MGCKPRFIKCFEYGECISGYDWNSTKLVDDLKRLGIKFTGVDIGSPYLEIIVIDLPEITDKEHDTKGDDELKYLLDMLVEATNSPYAKKWKRIKIEIV